MVEREKVVVILLLVTIILSIVSVFVTLAVPGNVAADSGGPNVIMTQGNPDDSNANLGFELIDETDERRAG